MTMFNRKTVAAACVVLVMGLVAVTASQARDASVKVNYLTFSGPVALPGVVLPAGSYVFEMPDARLDIVRITTRDRSRERRRAQKLCKYIDRRARWRPL